MPEGGATRRRPIGPQKVSPQSAQPAETSRAPMTYMLLVRRRAGADDYAIDRIIVRADAPANEEHVRYRYSAGLCRLDALGELFWGSTGRCRVPQIHTC